MTCWHGDPNYYKKIDVSHTNPCEEIFITNTSYTTYTNTSTNTIFYPNRPKRSHYQGYWITSKSTIDYSLLDKEFKMTSSADIKNIDENTVLLGIEGTLDYEVEYTLYKNILKIAIFKLSNIEYYDNNYDYNSNSYTYSTRTRPIRTFLRQMSSPVNSFTIENLEDTINQLKKVLKFSLTELC